MRKRLPEWMYGTYDRRREQHPENLSPVRPADRKTMVRQAERLREQAQQPILLLIAVQHQLVRSMIHFNCVTTVPIFLHLRRNVRKKKVWI